MGLFDSLFGRDQKSSSEQDITTDTNVERNTNRAQAQAGSSQTGQVTQGQTDTAQTRRIDTLDPAVQQQLVGLIETLGGSDVAGGNVELINQLAGTLAERAGDSEDAINADIAGIVDSARLQGERALEEQNTANIRQAGSSFNTLVQAANQRGREDLETRLAGFEGELGLQGRQLTSQEFAAAVDAATRGGELAAGAGLESTRLITDLAQVLRGATSTEQVAGTTGSRQESQTVQQQTQALVDVIEELTKGRTRQRGSTSSDTTQTPSVFDLLLAL